DDLRDTIFGAIANGDTNRRWRRPAAERRAHGIDCRRSGGAIMFAAPRDCAGIICGNRQDRVFANFNSENHASWGLYLPASRRAREPFVLRTAGCRRRATAERLPYRD